MKLDVVKYDPCSIQRCFSLNWQFLSLVNRVLMAEGALGIVMPTYWQSRLARGINDR